MSAEELQGPSSGASNYNVLSQFIDLNGICKNHGQNHRFSFKLDNVKPSIDVISELSREKKILKAV